MPRPWYQMVVDRTRQRHGRLTPLADLSPVVSVMLIFAVTLFVSSGMIHRPGIRVDLPEVSEPEALRGDILALTVTQEGEVYQEGEAAAAGSPERLAAVLKAFQAASPEGLVLINADSGCPQGRIVKLLEIIREAGLARIAYGTRFQNPQQQGENHEENL